MANINNDDRVQHGIDDDPHNDAEKGAALGGLGGVAVGAAAGSLAGPVGTVVGAVVGGLTGAGASGLAVGAVDQVDNDNTVSGVGSGATNDINTSIGSSDIVGDSGNTYSSTGSASANAVYPSDGSRTTPDVQTADVSDMNSDRGLATTPNVRMESDAANLGTTMGGSLGNTEARLADGVQTPTNVGPDGTPDQRGFVEKVADAATGNHVDDKTGNPVGGINTGGHAIDGTADTRGITEKAADAITGDRTDDKTGKTV